MECYNGVCDGTGYDGHKMCGCESCEFHSMQEDVEVCTNEKILEEISNTKFC